MSTASGKYNCPACTFEQSITQPTCEMCETPNPNFDPELFPADEDPPRPAPKNRTRAEDVTCNHCGYINIGHNIRTCVGCKKPIVRRDHLREFLQNFAAVLGHPVPGMDNIFYDPVDNNDDDDDDDDNDDDDVVMVSNDKEPETSQGKAATAVEKALSDPEIKNYFDRYILLIKDKQQGAKQFSETELNKYVGDLFCLLEYKLDESRGQLTFPVCQICMDESEPMITMKICGHCVVCAPDFRRYLSTRIGNNDILPWIPCPADSCYAPCHVDDIIHHGQLTYDERLSFLTTYMFKKLCRNENFITCIGCQQGGFLQFGPPRKENVVCPVCNEKQTIEKGVDGDLDISFKKMIKTGQLRECPTCRHLTLKEKGLCNIIECAKCGIWWNWRTREQGQSGSDLKQRARINGTLWEPGELKYQQKLERKNPEKFKALLERNGIKYNPNYRRGTWNDE